MAGRLIVMDEAFFEDFETNTHGMQFSGDNRDALHRLRKLAQDGFPQRWGDLMRWPVQCTCGHSMEFAVLYYVAKMACPMCRANIGAPDLLERLTAQPKDRDRYLMLVASMGDDVFTFGEEECAALRAVSRMSDDIDILAETANTINEGAKYRRPQ